MSVPTSSYDARVVVLVGVESEVLPDMPSNATAPPINAMLPPAMAAVFAKDVRFVLEHFSGFEIRYISLVHLFVRATAGAIMTAQLINADKNVLYKLINFSVFGG